MEGFHFGLHILRELTAAGAGKISLRGIGPTSSVEIAKWGRGSSHDSSLLRVVCS